MSIPTAGESIVALVVLKRAPSFRISRSRLSHPWQRRERCNGSCQNGPLPLDRQQTAEAPENYEPTRLRPAPHGSRCASWSRRASPSAMERDRSHANRNSLAKPPSKWPDHEPRYRHRGIVTPIRPEGRRCVVVRRERSSGRINRSSRDPDARFHSRT